MRQVQISCFALFLLLGTIVSAQQIPVVHVGVIAEDSHKVGLAPNSSEAARWQRDLVVNYLNHRKPSKDSRAKVEAVALETTALTYVSSEARDKGCDYIVRLGIGSPEQDRDESPQAVSYSIRRLKDNMPLPGTPVFVVLPRSGTAMILMSSIYDALVKAGKP